LELCNSRSEEGPEGLGWALAVLVALALPPYETSRGTVAESRAPVRRVYAAETDMIVVEAATKGMVLDWAINRDVSTPRAVNRDVLRLLVISTANAAQKLNITSNSDAAVLKWCSIVRNSISLVQ
jgi:MYXO-CTERM domain-containing protein